jgi:hypothetical protein
MTNDAVSGLQAMAENVPDGRPVFPLVAPDRYYDEPEASEEGALTALIGWGSRASKVQRCGMLKLVQWIHEAPDAERRVILILFESFQGRVPIGAVNGMAVMAGCSVETVRVAMKRFTKFFPDAISPNRKRCE